MNWKPMVGYEDHYKINENGDVIKIKSGRNHKPKILKRHIQPSRRSNILEREYYKLYINGKRPSEFVHRALAKAFIPNPQNLPQVNHIDGNPLNNELSNLEWTSAKDNVNHAFDNHLIKTRKPVLQFDLNWNFLARHEGEAVACRYVGVSQGKVGRAIREGYKCMGYYWKYEVKA